jgi:hypothetical protein
MICVNQNYSKSFAKMHKLAKKIKKREARMGESMCQFKFPPKEIEYFDEDKGFFFP